MKKKTKEFRPCKIPRYLVGSVSPHVLKTDLAEYNAHRYKVGCDVKNVKKLSLRINVPDIYSENKNRYETSKNESL
jgi:hypothetical protein